MFKNIFNFVFSTKKECKHKVITIFGLKIKILDISKVYLEQLSLIHDELKNIKNGNIKNINSLDVLLEEKFQKLKKDIDFQIYWKNSSLYDEYDRKAHLDTIHFIDENIETDKILFLKDRWKNLKYCATKNNISGLFLECGVHTGRSINYLAKILSNKTIYGFDSFEGLPQEWTGFTMQSGDFDLNGELPKVCNNVELHKGLFNNTLPEFLKDKNEKIAFLHVDCDLYQSTADVLNVIYPYLQKGTIIVFDEFFNYPNWRNHEFKAFNEFIEKNRIEYKYISIGHLQVGIEIVKLEEC